MPPTGPSGWSAVRDWFRTVFQGAEVAEDDRPPALSDNDLRGLVIKEEETTDRYLKLLAAEQELEMGMEKAHSDNAIARFKVAMLWGGCAVVLVILALALLVHAARGVRVSLPKGVWMPLSIVGAALLTWAGRRLGAFLRGRAATRLNRGPAPGDAPGSPDERTPRGTP
ncbi:hypothetical protein AB0B50_24520 [Streptomyces sp. NPDC041068]|uniref:hypothetical protein n=1 Tax=Streptomyces sp. NPDC041068 TaxID=3155130 RepID=UPI0033C7FBE3